MVGVVKLVAVANVVQLVAVVDEVDISELAAVVHQGVEN